ncbi:polysaccharide biosynthesis/export family protein [Roseobacter fucihabitans]|nr:polysaccharide biosynthesis/export family protein [Roseobacter litoralis]
MALFTALAMLVACTLPQVGPSKKQIFEGSVQKQGDAFIVAVNDHVTRATAAVPSIGFSQGFKDARKLGSDTIRPGDILGLTIWENVEQGLLAGDLSNATLIESVQVDGDGFIFVPYAGRIRAAGNSPEAIRRIITAKLEEQTPDPQVEVRREAGDGSTVSLTGAVGAQGIYAIERPTRTLSTMLARAGGVTIDPEAAQITVIRGSQRSRVWFQDLYDHPGIDIALRGGDRILVQEDTRAFTALGATGTQARVSFDTQNLSSLEAIAQVGGLVSTTSDPTGVFVFRNEASEIAADVLGRDDLNGPQRMIYLLDLTKPNGMFVARDFVIRDGDTIYVTEAPISQWNKAVAAVFGSLLAPAANISTLAN